MQTPSLSTPDWPSAPGKWLIECLAPYVSVKTFPKGKKLPLRDKDNGLCYMIMQGVSTAHRVSDDLMLIVLESPGLCGVGHFMLAQNSIYLKTYTECKIAVFTSKEFEEMIVRENLWQPLSLYLISVINKLFIATTALSYTTAYEKVRFQLLQLNNEPEVIKTSFTAAKYIKNKTNISRSGIMRILSELRQGGYIVIENGFLLKVNKLPLRY